MAPGDIGLVRIHGGVGLGIRLGQWLLGDGFQDFEHAFMQVNDVHLIEAEPGGARVAGLDEYAGERIVWLPCPDQYRPGVVAAALELVGTPYSFLDYLSLALRRFHVPAPHLRAYIQSSGHMICSQLADRAAALGGWHLWDDRRWEGDVTPGDLYQLAEGHR